MKVEHMEGGHSPGRVEQVKWREAVVEHDCLECGHVLQGIEALVERQEDELGVLHSLAQVRCQDVQAHEHSEWHTYWPRCTTRSAHVPEHLNN